MKFLYLFVGFFLLLNVGTLQAEQRSGFQDVQVEEQQKSWENLSKAEKKAFRKNIRKSIKEVKKGKKSNEADVGLFILAVLLPPLSVYLYEGEITNNFWIDLVLILLFWVPSIVYAVLVLTDTI
ncbi:MAG: YqaE/Pmp3 family membrane protein [Bacteroidota bacterium]